MSIYPGGEKAEEPAPNFPTEFTADHRVTCYWYAHKLKIHPRNSNEWHNILRSAQREAAQRKQGRLS